jgi:hypothetical protein
VEDVNEPLIDASASVLRPSKASNFVSNLPCHLIATYMSEGTSRPADGTVPLVSQDSAALQYVQHPGPVSAPLSKPSQRFQCQIICEAQWQTSAKQMSD